MKYKSTKVLLCRLIYPIIFLSLSLSLSLFVSHFYLSISNFVYVVYASQQHEQFLPDGTRAGFLIGDGAGVGKGRTIAGKSKYVQ